jgi:ADP-heptose:LPS heptosyltransferase
LSVSISPSEALLAVRGGERLSPAVIRALGEEQPAEFFRILIESLADSFDPTEAAAYEEIMRAWIAPLPRLEPSIPSRVDTVYVLSRVTLGADIKITSAMLDCMKTRFPTARIVLVSNRKSAELFAADSRIEHFNADYPRSGPVSSRLEFAYDLKRRFDSPNSIVVDPDSRMTQLGLIPLCSPDKYFHFPSRTAAQAHNLTDLTRLWLQNRFGQPGTSYIAPNANEIDGISPRAAVSFGVGENESKRIPGNFEARVIQALGRKFSTIWIDRGVGGEEGRRVTEAVASSGCEDRVRFWEGSFAGFASVISQCDFYTGYDSAGQHAAAACGVRLATFFNGASTPRFRRRWSPSGPGAVHVIDADLLSPEACLAQFSALLE